jgi:AraC family transcriptional regulator
MNAPAWSKEFPFRRHVEQSYVNGANERLALADGFDTMILPLGSIRLEAFPGTPLTEMSVGSMLFVPASTCKEVAFSGRFSVIVMHVAVTLRHEMQADSQLAVIGTALPVLTVKNPQQISAIIQLFRRMTAAGDACTHSCLLSIARLLLWEVALSAGQERKGPPVRQSVLNAGKLRAIDRFVEDNLEEPLSLDQLAQHAGMSRYYFLRCFKAATGISPLQYVIAKRVERARDMLSNGSESIAEIAYASGFSSQSHLNWAFKRHFGVTPGAFKREHRNASDRNHHHILAAAAP